MAEKIQRLTDDDWKVLIDALDRKSCTPFLGPELVADGFQQRRTIAERLAKEYGSPDEQWEYLDDPTDLTRVGRFVSVRFDTGFARSKYFDEYNSLPVPDFQSENDPHVGLASLPIPIYITTNHNQFMM